MVGRCCCINLWEMHQTALISLHNFCLLSVDRTSLHLLFRVNEEKTSGNVVGIQIIHEMRLIR